MTSANPEMHYVAAVATGWPVTWHPQLQHAPSGRTSGLWCATTGGHIVNFDGTVWTQQPGDALSVATGRDGSVFAVGKTNPQQLSQWSGTAFTPVAQHPSNLSQVSVGGQNQVWARDSNNTVNQLSQGQLQPVALAGSAAHIAANYDGTLWSCTGNDAHALRLAPDLQQPPAAIAAAGTVQKVASTGFGVSHCLVGQDGSAQLYRYDSPYVFRTADTYNFTTGQPIEQGLGSLFFLIQSREDAPGQRAPTYQVVALDAHTGVELSRSAVAPSNLRYTAPAFDPLHETIVVGLTTNPYAPGPQPGQLLGLDARNLSTVRWSITLPNNLPLGPGRPTLQGTQLCVSDNSSTLVMYDTGASPTATTPTFRWTYSFPASSGLANILPPPVLANGNVYAVWWVFDPGYGYLQIYLGNVKATTGTGTQPTKLPTGPAGFYYDGDPKSSTVWASASPSMAEFPPVLATVPGPVPTGGQSRQMLFVNGGTRVWAVDVDALTVKAYVLPGSTFGPNDSTAGPGSKILSGLSFTTLPNVNSGIGVLWFGDDGANLHAVNCQDMTGLPGMPLAPAPGGQGIATTPVPYTDAQGDAAVLVSVTGAPQSALLVFDPISHNVVSVPTQGTNLIALSTTVTNGVVYGGGGQVNSGSASAPSAQVFGIRVDQAVQELRDFIVDSQLMQDFDDKSEPTYNADGVARYQTHMTLVDHTKAPLIHESVKLWADQPNTIVLVNGQSYTLGPDDDQFASVKTSSSGQLLIVSGYTQADGSDTTDMNAVPLRAWAPFMNPYERMLVIRDQEFHNRVATAHSTDPSQAGADDPTRANLQTSQTYGDLKNQGTGTSNPLFTAQQKQDNQPQQVANAIQNMTGSVGSASPSGSKSLIAARSLHATEAAGSYIAYTNTPGVQYSPVNVAANRAAVVLKAGGLAYSRGIIPPNTDPTTVPPAYVPTTPAQAAMAIDALDGQDWSTSKYAPPHVQATAAAAGVGGKRLLGDDFWTDFWDWLKGAVATVTDVIVSVAEDIYAGIRILVNGIAYVFTTIITGIEQAVNAIGAFFIQLGHLIEEVIEALSVLFQFGHIIDTHNLLKNELLKRINGDGTAAYPGLVALVGSTATGSTPATGAIAQVDSFFSQGEQTINDKFNSLANALSGTPSSSLAGGGSTVHSAFTASPKGGGASSSNSTQATWGLQKFQSGVGAGGAAATAIASVKRLQGVDDPTTVIGAIFTDFATRLSSDAQLSNQWAQVQSGAQQMNNTSSGADFVENGLAELLRILALIIDGVLAVTNAFVDAILGGIAALVEVLFDPSSGLLTAPLDIPVLSWLYQLLFDEPLTILNAVLLVIAIPVTILWRIIESEWPSDSVNAVAARPAALGQGLAIAAIPTTLGQGLAPTSVQELLGVTSALFSLVNGFMFGITDLTPNAPADTPLVYIVSRIELALSVLGSVVSAPIWTENAPDSGAWTAWGVGLGSGLLNIVSAIPSLSAATDSKLSSGLESALSMIEAIITGNQFHDNPPKNNIGDAALGLSIAALLPGFVNPIKLNSETGAIVVAACDVIFGVVGCVAGFLSTFNPGNSS